MLYEVYDTDTPISTFYYDLEPSRGLVGRNGALHTLLVSFLDIEIVPAIHPAAIPARQPSGAIELENWL